MGCFATDHREKVSKVYQTGHVRVQALKEGTFSNSKGAFLSIIGPSGSGKTTLLNLVGCLDKLSESFGDFLSYPRRGGPGKPHPTLKASRMDPVPALGCV